MKLPGLHSLVQVAVKSDIPQTLSPLMRGALMSQYIKAGISPQKSIGARPLELCVQ